MKCSTEGNGFPQTDTNKGKWKDECKRVHVQQSVGPTGAAQLAGSSQKKGARLSKQKKTMQQGERSYCWRVDIREGKGHGEGEGGN